MRIAIFTNNYLPNPYGVSMSIESFRAELEKLGHTVYVFAPETKGYEDKNPKVFRYPSIDLNYKISFPLAIPYSYRIDRILEKLEIDVIHSQHPNLLGWAAEKWAKKKKVPLVFTWHTLYDQYAHFAPPFIPQALAKWWTISNAVNYANKANWVIAPTKSVIEIIKKWGVRNKNVTDVMTGIDENQLVNSERDKIRTEKGVKENEILMVVVTRFTEEKNVEFLFKSVVKVLKNNANAKFLAGGDGNLNERLKEFIEKENLSDKVIFTGFVPNNEKKNYYAAGDIFVFASRSETQGMVISEAMYLGLPVVAVAATGVKDLVTNQVTGLLVKEDEEVFARAVERLVVDGELRAKFSENARKIARENYTAKASTSKLLAIYEKAMENKIQS